MKSLKFREKYIVDLIKIMLKKDSDERIFMELGLHGTGKSSIAKNAFNYLYERKLIEGGLLWI